MNIGARLLRIERACPGGRYHVISGWSREEVERKKTELRAGGKLAFRDTLFSIAVIDGHQAGPAVTVTVRP
jgi:hypothetical protein